MAENIILSSLNNSMINIQKNEILKLKSQRLMLREIGIKLGI